MSNGYTSKCSRPYWSNPPFVIFWHSGPLALRTQRQSAWCQKIIKGWLDPYGAECFCRLIFGTIRKSVGLKGWNQVKGQSSYNTEQASHGLRGSAGLKMHIHAHFFRRHFLTHKVCHTDLVFSVLWGFISSSRLQVSVCSSYILCHPGWPKLDFCIFTPWPWKVGQTGGKSVNSAHILDSPGMQIWWL